MWPHTLLISSSWSRISQISLLLLNLPNESDLALRLHMLCFDRRRFSLVWCQINPMIPTTPPSHMQKQRQSLKNEVRVGVFAFFACPCPTFSLPSCSPENSSSLQVKLISLQVDWVILCLAVLLGYCFVCLSGNVWHKLSSLFDSSLRWSLRIQEVCVSIDVSTAARRLLR